MIFVFFEYSGVTTDLVAAFSTEKTYMACLPTLEALAAEDNATIIESDKRGAEQ